MKVFFLSNMSRLMNEEVRANVAEAKAALDRKPKGVQNADDMTNFLTKADTFLAEYGYIAESRDPIIWLGI